MFEKAAFKKYRFETSYGSITVEDVCALPLTSSTKKTSLDDVARSLYKELQTADMSFVAEKTTANTELQDKFDLVMYIIKTKKEAADAAHKEMVRRAKEHQILTLIADKKNAERAGKSIEELEKMLEEL